MKNKSFIKSAQLKLQKSNAKVIAITGSNGKTSVKNILYSMINKKYNVLKTPASYNTPLGIAKFINEKLTEDCEFVILEYGARHKNDIKKLCKLFGADYGIVTTISPQHLESFKSVENIYKAKQQLPNYLQNCTCVFNIDNLYTIRMYNNKIGSKVSTSTNNHTDIYANEIKIKDYKTEFNIHINNNSYLIKTNLLGKHNIANILQASALAIELNANVKDIIENIKELQPTPHRLELIQNDLNILDDSYNCSLTSAKEALWVLSNFNNKKMVVTPGIIEGGKKEYNLNFQLGKLCANCDYVVIVGNHNKQAIYNGLKSTNFNDKKICFASSLDNAKKYFSLLNNGDNLLLLNDLPDDYK